MGSFTCNIVLKLSRALDVAVAIQSEEGVVFIRGNLLFMKFLTFVTFHSIGHEFLRISFALSL